MLNVLKKTEASPVLGNVSNVKTGDSLLQPWELRDLNMCRYVQICTDMRRYVQICADLIMAE